MTHYAVTAIGADRPGIVAGLTGALFEAGANLEDVSSTILRGHFAMMLVVDLPDHPEALEERLAEAMRPLGVSVTVREAEAGSAPPSRATHVLSVHGADRPGIVAGFAGLLAGRGVNITDLSCRRAGDEGHEVYVMLAELALPEGSDDAAFDAAFSELGERLSVDVSFRPIEADVL